MHNNKFEFFTYVDSLNQENILKLDKTVQIIFRNYNKNFKNKMLKNIPLGRVAKESDVATAVAFLAADSSEMITGTSLLVDGGWTAQ